MGGKYSKAFLKEVIARVDLLVEEVYLGFV